MSRGSALACATWATKPPHLVQRKSKRTEYLRERLSDPIQNAQNNLTINQAAGKGNTFANNGLPGQSALPIFASAFGTTTGSLYTQFTTQFQTGAAGSVARSLAGTQSFVTCSARSSRLRMAQFGRGGDCLPHQLLRSKSVHSGRFAELSGFDGQLQLPRLAGGVPAEAEPWHAVQRELYALALAGGGPSERISGDAGGSFQTDRDFRLSYRSSYDIRHNFHLSGTYDLPFGKGKAFLNQSRLADEVGGGRTLGTIMIIQSGPPSQITGGYLTVNGNDGGVNFAPGVTAKTIQNAVGVYRTGNPWVNTVNPSYWRRTEASARVTIRRIQRPRVRSESLHLWPALVQRRSVGNKTIPIKESVRATFQAQLLDVFNHPIFGLGTLAAQSLSFGQQTGLLTSTSYRRIDLRLNIEF